MARPKRDGRGVTHPSTLLTFTRQVATFLQYAFCTLAACGLLVAGYAGARYSFHFIYRSEFFQINEMRIEGASEKLGRHIHESLAAYLDENGTNLCRMDPDIIGATLNQLPRALETVVSKEYPQSLVIHVRERKPIMIANLNEPVLIDREGVILGRAEHEIIEHLDLPMLTGIGTNKLKMGDRLVKERLSDILSAAEFIRNDDPDLHGKIVEWNINSRNEVTSILRSKTEVRFGSQPPLELLAKLSSVLKQKPEIEESYYVDLRMQNQIVYHIDG